MLDWLWPSYSSTEGERKRRNRKRKEDFYGEELVEVEKEISHQYTEHTATAEFTDGETREFTFDEMNQTGSAIVLKDYVAAHFNDKYLLTGLSEHIDYESEAFITLSNANLKTFETTDRETKEMTETYTDMVPKSEADDSTE